MLSTCYLLLVTCYLLLTGNLPDYPLDQLDRRLDVAGDRMTEIAVLAAAIFGAKMVVACLHAQQLPRFGKLQALGRSFVSL